MNGQLRMAEAVCAGHPDRLADTIAERITDLACARDRDALVSIEVALYRRHVFVDGQIAAGTHACVVSEQDVDAIVRDVYRDAGYGRVEGVRSRPSDAAQPTVADSHAVFHPEPDTLRVTCELCLAPLDREARELRPFSDDQAIAVGHAVWGPRAGFIPLEQALANDFVRVLEALRRTRPDLRVGPDGKALVVVRGRTLAGVSISVQHLPSAEWIALTTAVRQGCEQVAFEYVAAGELDPLEQVDWLINGAGAFELGGPLGDNGLSGKKLVAQAYGTAVPIGGGARFGKDVKKPDPCGQARARQMALDLVVSGQAREATVWLAWRPGDIEPHFCEVVTTREAAPAMSALSEAATRHTPRKRRRSMGARPGAAATMRSCPPAPTRTGARRSTA